MVCLIHLNSNPLHNFIINSLWGTHWFSHLYKTDFHALTYACTLLWAFSLSFSLKPCIYTQHNHSASCLHFMAFFLFAILFLMVPSSNAYWPPSPGYWPSSKFRSMSFYKGFRNLWGPQHQILDQSALAIWLDRTSGLNLISLISL